MAEAERRQEGGGDAEGGREPPRPSHLVQELREGSTAPTLTAVVIAWALTLAPSGFGRGASWPATVLCVAALGAGLGGPLLARTGVTAGASPPNPRARMGRHVGISLFVALATATWLVGDHAIHPLRLDPIRGLFGAVAWGVFALSWSERWGSSAEAEPIDPEAPLLLPRAALPMLATTIATVGVLLALAYLALGFRARDPDRALVAQAVALACGVAVVVAAGVVATARGKHRPLSGRRLTPPVVRALLLLVTTAIAGAVLTALR
jgi:hypothetical protein